jgi:uncharacterized integral membrane protein
MLKAVLKILVLLALLFVLVYVGMHNTHEIDLHFPIAGTTLKKPFHFPAALLYFGMFAIGVVAGTVLANLGGGGGRKSSAKDR